MFIRFLDLLMEKEKFYLLINIIKSKVDTVVEDIKKMRDASSYDLLLSGSVIFIDKQSQLMTYEERAYCVLVPIPKKTSILQI